MVATPISGFIELLNDYQHSSLYTFHAMLMYIFLAIFIFSLIKETQLTR